MLSKDLLLLSFVCAWYIGWYKMNVVITESSFTSSNISSWLPGCTFDSWRDAAKAGLREVIAHPFQALLRRVLGTEKGTRNEQAAQKPHVCTARPEMRGLSRRCGPAEEFAQICEQQQMVSMRWGMLRWENASILTGIPWRPSLRCGMLFLSWDWRVWAWMPERWSSARRRTDFSPLRARLPWLSAHTGPKHWMRNVCSPQSAWLGCLFSPSLSFHKDPNSKRVHETSRMPEAMAKQQTNR